MKMRRPHRIPLAPQTIAILEELHTLTGQYELLFPGVRSPSRPLSENTLNAALRRLGYAKDDMSSHGFRAAASSLLNECSINPKVKRPTNRGTGDEDCELTGTRTRRNSEKRRATYCQ
jgi:integrase